MRFGFGLLTCQRFPGDLRSDVELYSDTLDLAVFAEELGFDSVWTSEHHFVDDGYAPSLPAAVRGGRGAHESRRDRHRVAADPVARPHPCRGGRGRGRPAVTRAAHPRA